MEPAQDECMLTTFADEAHERVEETKPDALARIARPRPLRLDRLARDCETVAAQVERLRGPGVAAVRSAARALIVALELYMQQQRRVAAEVLRAAE